MYGRSRTGFIETLRQTISLMPGSFACTAEGGRLVGDGLDVLGAPRPRLPKPIARVAPVHAVAAVPPLEGGVTTCAQPGRLVVAEPTVWADLLGDMTSMTPAIVGIAARHAASAQAPRGLAEFLDVCATYGLSLNKYVVAMNAAPP